MMHPEYYLIVKIMVIVFFLACMLVFLSFFLNYQDNNFLKQSTYECGFQPFKDARQAFDIEFYLVGILFIIFDLEIVFFFPLCLCLFSLGIFGFSWVLFFFVVLTIDFIMNG